MITDEIKKIIENHEKRLSYLESIMGKAKTKSSTTTDIQNKEKKTLPDHIIALRDAGFFSQPETAEETLKKLQDNYHCELNRVEVGLVRLAKRKLLRKASKAISGKKYQAYVW